VLRHGTYSVLEALWRVAIVRANLIQESRGRIAQSSAFRGLDPSERGAVSYFLGLTFTKLIAEKLFGVPWLLHLDVYRQDLNPYLALKVKPDFVGMDAQNQWLVAESKGRTSSIGREDLLEAKKQTRSLRNLNGQLPALRIAVGTYFSSHMSRARIFDPEDFDDDASDLDIRPDDFARAYYRPVIEVVEQLPAVETTAPGAAVRTVELTGLDARVGIDEDIVAWYHGERHSWEDIVVARRTAPSVLAEIRVQRSGRDSDREALLKQSREPSELLTTRRLREVSRKGLDGVSVELGPSWAEHFMRREPRDRGQS
jgi:hypothetical protein